MEYLCVRFAEQRKVLIGRIAQGETDGLIELEPGTYTVTLSGAPNFSPKKQKIVLADTSPIKPMEVRFDKV